MTFWEWIAIISLITPVTIGIGVLIFRLGELHSEMQRAFGKIISMDIKVEKMWRERTTVKHSPSVLNKSGQKILDDSNIKEFTDKYFNDIIYKVKKLTPKNAYEAQEFLINVVRDLKNKDSYRDELEESISKSCSDIDTILFVAAINMRDIVIEYLNFKREDIDKFDPQKGIEPKK